MPGLLVHAVETLRRAVVKDHDPMGKSAVVIDGPLFLGASQPASSRTMIVKGCLLPQTQRKANRKTNHDSQNQESNK